MKFEKCLTKNNLYGGNLKEHTKELYNYAMHKYIEPYFNGVNVNNISLSYLQNYLNSLADQNYSTNTIKLIWRLLKSVLSNPEQDFLENINIQKIIIPKTKEKEVNTFSIAEQKLIERYAKKSKKECYFGVLLAMYLGLRLGEVLALKWEDFNFENNTINVKRTVYLNHSNKLMFSSPKTKTSTRVIPIPNFLINRLVYLYSKSKCEFVVCRKNKPVLPRTYQKMFENLQTKVGIKNIKGFHSLRHTFATRALEIGMDVKSLADIMGHKNPNITLSRYAHSMMEHKQNMLNKMGKIYSKRFMLKGV